MMATKEQVKKIEELVNIYYDGDEYYKELALHELENGLTLEDIEELMIEVEL